MPNDTVPATLYVEGYATSSSVRDVTLQLEYGYWMDTVTSDNINITVVEVELTHVHFDYSSRISTSLTATVLTDTHANWTVNEFQGKELNPDITQSTTFTVASNTQTTITISAGDMTGVASVGDKYAVIYDDDALSIRENYTTDMDLPEWVTSLSRNEPATYIKQKSVTIWARLTVMPTAITSAKIRATSSDFLGNLGEQTVSFSSGVSSPPYIRFTAASSTPNYVNKDTVTWEWKYRDVNGTGSGDLDVSVGTKRTSGPHTIYVLLARPDDPWQEWGQRRVWTEVLDYACVWADQDADESQAVDGITVGAYNSFGKNYEGWHTHASGTTLDLTDLLSDSWADCRDMSATVHVFTRAIGGSVTEVRWIDGRFWYQSIDPIGAPGWTTPGPNEWWNFHQVGHYSNVYDACIRLDPSTPRIPCNEAIDGTYYDDRVYNSVLSFNHARHRTEHARRVRP